MKAYQLLSINLNHATDKQRVKALGIGAHPGSGRILILGCKEQLACHEYGESTICTSTTAWFDGINELFAKVDPTKSYTYYNIIFISEEEDIKWTNTFSMVTPLETLVDKLKSTL